MVSSTVETGRDVIGGPGGGWKGHQGNKALISQEAHGSGNPGCWCPVVIATRGQRPASVGSFVIVVNELLTKYCPRCLRWGFSGKLLCLSFVFIRCSDGRYIMIACCFATSREVAFTTQASGDNTRSLRANLKRSNQVWSYTYSPSPIVQRSSYSGYAQTICYVKRWNNGISWLSRKLDIGVCVSASWHRL